MLGDAANRLLASPDFDVFVKELERRRALVIQQSLMGRADDYETYRELRGAFLAFNEVIGMAEQLKAEADTIREQTNESE